MGSSAISRSGFRTRDIAIMARWRMPPEYSWGYCLARSSGRGMPTRRSISIASLRASFFETCWWARTASTIWSPTRKNGCSELMGSWNTIPIFWPRMPRSSSGDSFSRSWPSKMTSPSIRACLRVTRPMIVRNETLLPDPDSPTTPSVCPGYTENETPSTALTSPSSVGKWTFRFRTSSSGSATAPPAPDVGVMLRPRLISVMCSGPSGRGTRRPRRPGGWRTR